MAISPGVSSTSGELDGELFVYFGSNVTDVIPKTDWIKNITAINGNYWRNYWSSEKARLSGEIYTFQHFLNLTVRVLNPTKGKNKHS